MYMFYEKELIKHLKNGIASCRIYEPILVTLNY